MDIDTTFEEFVPLERYVRHLTAGFTVGIIIGAICTTLLFIVAAEFLI